MSRHAVPSTPEAPAAIAPGAEAYAQLQTSLQDAKPGDVIEIGEGTFDFTDGLSLDVDNVTVKGAGQDKTILSFKGQTGAGEGLLVTSDGVTLTGFTMQDTKGDGIKSKGADNITYKDLKVEWTGEPSDKNGAYGVYPVESTNVLIDGVTVKGASDAGIYVGQSDNIIVRNSRAEYNVAGIEIENSTHADVYDNVATKNAGGILVFDLPGAHMTKVGGHSTRVFRNQVVENDTPNFAAPGSTVAAVPTGTGVLLMANKNVHVFENTFDKNKTTHVMVISYSQAFDDARYNPLPRDFVIRDNTYGEGGNDPQGRLSPLAPALGGALPAIVWDGVTKSFGGSAKLGAVFVGKTAVPEMTLWSFAETVAFGATRNPWNTDYSPGGSSGGSAAASVAAGLASMALGSDGMGSIRIPSTWCGLFGIKPQRDWVPLAPHDDAWNGLVVNGPIARTVEDAALFLDVTSDESGFVAAAAKEPGMLRIAVSTKVPLGVVTRIGAQQRAAVEESVALLRELGHQVVMRDPDYPSTAMAHALSRYFRGATTMCRHCLIRSDWRLAPGSSPGSVG